ncbi:MAG: flagellar export chaperone FliS [Planctomycetes bacterium]|nr:flagellar export chaperone FliS [Planctomycetota bacterium]
MTESATNPYLHDAVLPATPEQLQLMLYDGAIRFASQGRDAIEAKDYATSYEKLTRAQEIISEMQAGLNYEVNEDLCKRVASIYNFIYRKLIDANVHRDTSAIDDALKVLRIERETWQIVVDKVNKTREQESPTASASSLSTDGDSNAQITFAAEG